MEQTFFGKVKWFNPDKGYGFILPEDGSRDVFIHQATLDKCGIKTLSEGQEVEYTTRKDKRNDKISAATVKPVN